MSVDPFDTGGATRKRRPALRGTVMLDVSMGKARVRVWPKKRGKAKTAEAKRLQDRFRQASWACKYWDPRNIVSVDELRKGTPVLIRDLQIMMMYGRFANFSMSDGSMVYTMEARQDVSDALDTICPLPGALLIRTTDGWRFVQPPTAINQQLTSTMDDNAPAAWEAAAPVVGRKTLAAPVGELSAKFSPAVNNYLMKLVVCEDDFTINKLGFACGSATPTATFQPFVYACNAALTTAGALLKTGPQIVGTVAGYNEAPLAAPLAVVKGQYIWIGLSVKTAAIANLLMQGVGLFAFAVNGGSTVPSNPGPAITTSNTPTNQIYGFWGVN